MLCKGLPSDAAKSVDTNVDRHFVVVVNSELCCCFVRSGSCEAAIKGKNDFVYCWPLSRRQQEVCGKAWMMAKAKKDPTNQNAGMTGTDERMTLSDDDVDKTWQSY